ncbi:hypothetical protein MMC29_007318 [Sticta canariensis]|nr:hypothetical protein [Sticta canariensis]
MGVPATSTMSESKLRATRVISVIAATLIALACGTNYAYSDWAPQFAERMKLSATQSNLIGTIANVGMYIAGIPVGLLVDSKGPRPWVLMGGLALGGGYFMLHRAYETGAGSISLPWLCVHSAATGLGGAAAFAGSIKTSALNWPEHRGTATAFPLAGFGLSAFVFSLLSSAFEDETGHFLLLLAVGTFALCFVGFFFLRVVPQSTSYFAIPTADDWRRESNPLARRRSGDSRRSIGRLSQEPGRQPVMTHENTPFLADSPLNPGDGREESEVHTLGAVETSSLLSKSSSSTPGDISFRKADENAEIDQNSPYSDIRGLAILPTIEFWQLFLLLGILTGIGLMTINNVGNDSRALWKHYDDSASPAFVQKQQMTNVSVISVLSFVGRLLSGVGSDLIVKKLHMSRYWCLFVSSVIFCIAQISAILIENPHILVLHSGLTGLAYGFLYGVYPSLVAETFGVGGLSTNWGFVIIAPAIFGNIFSILYGSIPTDFILMFFNTAADSGPTVNFQGRIYDSHSVLLPDGSRECWESRNCYSAAYLVTLGASVASVLISLWSIRHHNVTKLKTMKATKALNVAREA